MQEAKPFQIDKRIIFKAFKKVKFNRGSLGIDGIEMSTYEQNLGSNLYRLWNRMSSGSYMPKAVKLVEIPKSNGGKRPSRIPTIEDRIAQMAVVNVIEPLIEPCFHEDSFGYRPHRSAHDAIAKAERRCWKHAWVFCSLLVSLYSSERTQSVLSLASRICPMHVKRNDSNAKSRMKGDFTYGSERG